MRGLLFYALKSVKIADDDMLRFKICLTEDAIKNLFEVVAGIRFFNGERAVLSCLKNVVWMACGWQNIIVKQQDVLVKYDKLKLFRVSAL